MKNQSKLIIGFILVFIVAIFSVINTDKVAVNFGFATIQSPLIFIILGSTVLGALIVFVTWFSSFWKQRKEIKEMKTTIARYESEIEERVEQAIAAEKIETEQVIAGKQLRIDELEQQFRELTGELFIETNGEVPEEHN
ncbi:DUF1049 domain-containing protein [Vagococcus sp. BWB3-3]|uniref:DUF1049 domain-containing protein n=1 Tax=Vagococcus allomyrinae TaxID=2794353 RepID=A0A940SUR3_9ENTE|nr:LapA family protein [Vagococcus allomyrinae]MBP1044607.1 DUF1049 domain-containing protein [Vagococcus allomyrinae]